jgi:hypothetical protein
MPSSPWTSPTAPPAPAPRRRRTPLLVAAGVALVLIASIGYAASHSSHPTTSADHPQSSGPAAAGGGASSPSPSPSPSASAKVRSGPADVTVDSNDQDIVDFDDNPPMAVPLHAGGDHFVVEFTSGAPTLSDWDGKMTIAKYPASVPAPTKDQCVTAINRDGSYMTGDLSVGDRFCYQTPEGRITYIVVAAVPVGIGPLRLTATVWEQ